MEGIAEQPQKPKGFARELFSFVWEVLRMVAFSLIIILPIRYFVVQPFFVKGSSMIPNFHNQEYILVDRWTYHFGRPERGDVIVFRYPGNPKEFYIKRILGLPGESIIVGDNAVVVFNERFPDGFSVAEQTYLPATNPTYCGNNTTFCGRKVEIKENEYYVMGDNREHSSDSRAFGPVNKSFIAGLAWLRLWPLDEISSVPRVMYPPVIR